MFQLAILWVHAISGAVWIGAAACFLIAGLATAEGSGEQRNFVLQAAPRIGVLSIAAALLLVVTGTVNLANAAIMRGLHFSAAFEIVLGAKLIIFILMTIALAWARRLDALIDALVAKGRYDAIAGAMRRMMKYHGAIAALGAVAMMLGLWLIGS